MIPVWVSLTRPPSSRHLPKNSSILPRLFTRGTGRSGVGSGFHTFIVKLGNNYTGLSLTAQQTNRKRTEPEGVGAVPAHARGEGREVRERERQKRQKSLQINGIVLAAPGVGMVWGRGPSREERGGGKWHEPRETRPRSGQLTRPNPPPQPSHPTHERDTAPLPTQITRGDTVSPPHGQTYPPWNPLRRDAPPSQRSLTRRYSPKRLSLGQHKPSQHRRQPPPREEMAPGGRALERVVS